MVLFLWYQVLSSERHMHIKQQSLVWHFTLLVTCMPACVVRLYNKNISPNLDPMD